MSLMRAMSRASCGGPSCKTSAHYAPDNHGIEKNHNTALLFVLWKNIIVLYKNFAQFVQPGFWRERLHYKGGLGTSTCPLYTDGIHGSQLKTIANVMKMHNSLCTQLKPWFLWKDLEMKDGRWGWWEQPQIFIWLISHFPLKANDPQVLLTFSAWGWRTKAMRTAWKAYWRCRFGVRLADWVRIYEKGGQEPASETSLKGIPILIHRLLETSLLRGNGYSLFFFFFFLFPFFL